MAIVRSLLTGIRRLKPAIAVGICSTALVIAAAGLSGCGGASQQGEAQVWITRDRGEEVLRQGEVPAGLTALQGLDRLAEIETGYGGAFVNSIEGLETDHLRQRDWFYFVNGYEADRGAHSYRLRAGDKEWWDYRSWGSEERPGLVVGAFPEPFLHGYAGKRRTAVVRYERGLEAEARSLARIVGASGSDSVASRGTPVPRGANLLVVIAGKPALTASLRGAGRAGDPVDFVVSGKLFARRLVGDPAIVRFRYQVGS